MLQPEEAQQQGAGQLVKHLTQADGLPAGFVDEVVASLEPETLTQVCKDLGKTAFQCVVDTEHSITSACVNCMVSKDDCMSDSPLVGLLSLYAIDNLDTHSLSLHVVGCP